MDPYCYGNQEAMTTSLGLSSHCNDLPKIQLMFIVLGAKRDSNQETIVDQLKLLYIQHKPLGMV